MIRSSTVKLSPNGINGLAALLQCAVQTLSSGAVQIAAARPNGKAGSLSPSPAERGR